MGRPEGKYMKFTPYDDHFLSLQMNILNSVALRAAEELTDFQTISLLNQEQIMMGQLKDEMGDEEVCGGFIARKEDHYKNNKREEVHEYENLIQEISRRNHE